MEWDYIINDLVYDRPTEVMRHQGYGLVGLYKKNMSVSWEAKQVCIIDG